LPETGSPNRGGASEVAGIVAGLRSVGALLSRRLAEALPHQVREVLRHDEAYVRLEALTLLAGLLGLTIWAGSVDYALRVTSDTPTFIALVSDMAQRPFAEQSPFLAQGGVATQHATPYMQALAFLWSFLDGDAREPVELGRLLALVGLAVFAFTLYAVFLYVRRLAGTTAAWLSLPILLGLFGPPHVVWASDLTLHGALYASFFPQNLAMAFALLTLLALDRRSRTSLALACLLAGATMLIHPFTGVLLSVLATLESCCLAFRGERGSARAPLALGAGFALVMALRSVLAGAAWPWTALWLALAGLAHIWDLRQRIGGSRPGA